MLCTKMKETKKEHLCFNFFLARSEQAFFFLDRGFLTSCEAELQELMKQIDIMVAHKRAEWESRTQTLESCLDIREQELSSLRNALDEKRKEVLLWGFSFVPLA